MRTRMLVGAMALVLSMGVVACGDDEEDGGGGSQTTETSSGGDFTGDPVKIYFLGPVDSPITDLKAAISAIEVSIDRINSSGGLNGSELQLETCPDNTANDETACAQRAAEDGAIAFVGSASLFNAQAFGDALEQANLASIAPLAIAQVEYTLPSNFPIYTTSFGILTCGQQMEQSTESESFAGITQEIPVQQELLQTLEGIAAATGIDYKTGVAVPQTQTDFSSAVEELEESGADTVINILAPPTQPAFFQALNSVGAEFIFCGSTSTYNYDILTQLGEQADDIYVSVGLPGSVPEDTEVALLGEFYAEMKAAAEAGDEAADPDTFASAEALNAWLGMQILEQAAGEVQGDLTAQKVSEAMNQLRVEFEGVTPPLNFAEPPPGPLPRLFNPIVVLQKWDAAQQRYVNVPDAEPTNVLETLAALAEGGQG